MRQTSVQIKNIFLCCVFHKKTFFKVFVIIFAPKKHFSKVRTLTSRVALLFVKNNFSKISVIMGHFWRLLFVPSSWSSTASMANLSKNKQFKGQRLILICASVTICHLWDRVWFIYGEICQFSVQSLVFDLFENNKIYW